MSADNVITVLRTPRHSDEGFEYRVAEHGDSGSPLALVWSGENGQSEDDSSAWRSRLVDDDPWAVVYLVSIFGDCPVFNDWDNAMAEAVRIEEDYGFVEYGIQSHELDRSFALLVAEAAEARPRLEALRKEHDQPELDLDSRD